MKKIVSKAIKVAMIFSLGIFMGYGYHYIEDIKNSPRSGGLAVYPLGK